jgi:hypothetical protein
LKRSATLALGLVALAGAAGADMLQPRATDLAAKYEPFTLILGPTRRIVYGSYRGTLHLLESRGGQLVERQTRDLWSPVVAMVAADLNGDGQDEVVGYTQNSRLFVLAGTDLQDIWNTQEGRFNSITALTVGHVDDDGQLEIVLVADGLLRIFSGLQDLEEWKSSDTFEETDIEIGDVDRDGQNEIVLSSGLVLGAVFRDIEWRYDRGRFGNELDLFDIDGDGIVELVARGPDGLIRVFDLDQRQLKWN